MGEPGESELPVEVGASLRPILAQVWADRDRLVGRVAAEVTRRMPSYAATPSSEVWVGMTRILERVIEGDPFAPPTDADRQAAAGTGIQGARAGIAVDDLVAAVLLGARAVEDEVMRRAQASGVPAEVRLDGMRRAREWAEQVAVWAAQGLTHSSRGDALDREQATRLLTALRSSRDVDTVAEALAGVGLDPGGEHVVVVARSSRQAAAFDEVDAARLRFAHVERAVWIRDADSLVGVLRGAPSPVGDLVIGGSDPAAAGDLPAALRDADRASRTAASLAGPGLHTLHTLGLLVPLHEDSRLADRLVQRWVRPLESEPRHDLVETLRAWQRYGGNVDAAARELTLHANTVRNRIARIDRLLPAWREPQAQAELWAALVVDEARSRENLWNSPVPRGGVRR